MQALKNGSRYLRDGVTVTYLQSSDGATAVVADHGAHLLSWCPAGGDEALFLSSASGYGGNAAIRGGVPIIFPQFGALGSGQRHGFVRNTGWCFLGATRDDDGAASARWSLQQQTMPGARSHAAAGEVAGFGMICAIRLAGDSIDIDLTIQNTSTQAWCCQAALHTYLRVDALEAARVDGLQDAPYIDQTCPLAVGTMLDAVPTSRDAGALAFAAEVDRIYLEAPPRVVLRDGRRRMEVSLQGFRDMVVWNPGQAKAAALSDLHAGGFRQFICIEAAAIGLPVELAAGGSWCGAQSLRLRGD